MSRDLTTRLNGPLDRPALLAASERALGELLHVPQAPRLGFVHPGCVGVRDAAGELGYGVFLTVLTLDAQPPWVTEEEAGDYACVSTGGRHALPYALAAAVVMGLARLHGGDVVDDNDRWLRFRDAAAAARGCPPDVFCRLLANRSPFGDVAAAAEAFHSRLPVTA